MGLLRRAVGKPSTGGGPPARGESTFAKKPSTERRGLLGRTLGLGGAPRTALPHYSPDRPGPRQEPAADEPSDQAPVVPLGPPVREVRPANKVADELRSAIAALPDSVELPSRLFSLVAEKLTVGKGSLLLYDALRLVYAPWASQGYDQTTLHRLRIPLGANPTFNALANGEPLLVSDPGSLAPYQPFFSTREFSGLTRMFLTPFIAGDKLVGVLLLSGLQPPLPEEAGILECLKVVADAGAARVDSAREKRLATTAAAAAQAPATMEEQATRFIHAHGGPESPALFMTLSVEEYAHGILAGHQHLDPFRLYEDIRHFLGAFVADTGTSLPVRPGVFIVGLRSLDAQDIDLFTHQLGRHLDGLFGSGGAAQLRIVKKRAWPAEGNDIRSLLDYLAS